MNVTIQQTPTHTTFDGHTAAYCICRDIATSQRVAMFQVVDLGENVTRYRTMDRRSMPPDFTLNDAVKLTMVDERTRRGTPPAIVKRKPFTPPKEHHILRHLRPMQLPPEREYQRPPTFAPPMRRLMCDKLRLRAGKRAVA